MEYRVVRGGKLLPAAKRKWTKFAVAGLAVLMSIAPASIAPAHATTPSPPFHNASISWARPALWVVRDADTTIYLFGTFHTLDARTAWVDQRIRTALSASNELVLETVIPTDPADIRAIGDRQLVDRRDPAGKPALKPFVAETRAVVAQNRVLGLTVEHGADSVLRRLAEHSGKTVSGLETFEEQVATLASIPIATPPPGSAVAAAAVTEPRVTDLLNSWKSGNLSAYDDMLAGFSAQAPVAYRMLISDRNARWGQWIATRMDRPGTLFIAVGAGHLAGKDSVQQWLASRGIAASRVR